MTILLNIYALMCLVMSIFCAITAKRVRLNKYQKISCLVMFGLFLLIIPFAFDMFVKSNQIWALILAIAVVIFSYANFTMGKSLFDKKG